MVYMAKLTNFNSYIYHFLYTLIKTLKSANIVTNISDKYADFTNIFLFNQDTQLSEYTEMNNYAIKLIDDQKLF